MFDYYKIVKSNTVIYCDTEEKANKLLKWANSKGLKRNNGYYYELVGNLFNGLCYDFYEKNYCSLSYAKRNDFVIYNYEDALLKKVKKQRKIKILNKIKTNLKKDTLLDDISILLESNNEFKTIMKNLVKIMKKENNE